RPRLLLLDPEHLVQLPAGVELAHDVAPAHELAADVQLRDGGPGGVLLDALADRRIGEYGHGLVLGEHGGQELDRLGREAALREAPGPLHEQDHALGLDELFDLPEGVGGRISGHRREGYRRGWAVTRARPEVSVRVVRSLAGLDRDAWDALDHGGSPF